MKVLWQYHGVEEATWELESEMREKYPKKHLDAENATAIINEGTEISLPEIKQQETPKSPDRCVKHTESSS